MISAPEMTRVLTRWTLLFALLVAACTGGQTGDPGLGNPEPDADGEPEFVSTTDPAPQPPPDGDPGDPPLCAPSAYTDMTPAAGLRWPSHGHGTVLVAPRQTDYLTADYGFGLRVLSAGGQDLRAGAALRFDQPTRALFDVDGARALVVTDGSVYLVSMLDGAAPSVLAALPLPALSFPRGSTLLRPDGQPPVLAVLLDVLSEPAKGMESCRHRIRSEVLRVAIEGDALVKRTPIDLGEDITAARFEDDHLWTGRTTGTVEAPSGELTRVSLLAPEASPARWALAGDLFRAADLHVDPAGGAVDVLVGHRFKLTARWQRFQVDAPDTAATIDCELGLASGADQPGLGEKPPELTRGHRSLFVGNGWVVADRLYDIPAFTNGRYVSHGDDGCQVQRLTLPPGSALAAGPAGGLLAWGAPPHVPSDRDVPRGEPFLGQLSVVLLDPASGDTRASASLPAATEDGATRGYHPSAGRVFTDTQGQLRLLVPSTSVTADGLHESELHVLTVDDDALSSDGVLPGAFASLAVEDGMLTAGPEQLALYGLGAGPLDQLATGDVFPTADGGWLVDGAIVAKRPDVLTPGFINGDASGATTLDVHMGDGGRQRAMSLASARTFNRVGDLLVGFEATDYRCELVSEQTLQVLGLSNGTDLGVRGTLTETAFDPTWCTSEASRRLHGAVPDGLFGMPTGDGFQVLDLRASGKPQLYTLPAPREAVVVGRVPDGARIYQSYAVPQGEGLVGLSNIAYYLRILDATGEGEASASDPINLPGHLVHADGQDLWLLDRTRPSQGAEPQDALRRVVLVDGRAEVRASVDLPWDPQELHVLEGGVLAVENQDGIAFYDAGTLDEVGFVEVPWGRQVYGSSGPFLVVEDGWRTHATLIRFRPGDLRAKEISGARVADVRDGQVLLVRGLLIGDSYRSSVTDGALDLIDMREPGFWQ